ncbi:gasdermin-A-like isoform X2 [Varanus komodoensis]|uniref:gasdermin-A-like isoform X2 n=1 Tax=Varanus komodoensis TaxID=61221 RepID=UPI001CF78372|nr:gasdermin-A-like isoform X2 [Varanus komodoensis]
MSFYKATKSLAEQLDPKGELIAVDSIVDQNNFRPLCLVHSRSNNPWWKKHRFYKTGYKLCDVLSVEDHAAQMDVQDSTSIHIVNQVDGTLEGDIGGQVESAAVEVKGAASQSHERSVKVKKIYVSAEVLDSIIRKGKIRMGHELIKQSKEFQRNLHVITEAIEVVEETQFDESSKAEGGLFYEAWIKMRVKGTRGTKKAILIPKNCILAFTVKQLRIQGNLAGVYLYSNKKTRTFDGLQADTVECSRIARMKRAGIKQAEGHSGYRKDVCDVESRNLEEEVKQGYAEFSLLSTNLRGKFLKGFLGIIRDSDLLLQLEDQLEQAIDKNDQLKLKAGKPEVQGLVGNLHDSNGVLITSLAETVLYFLQALNELAEFQLMLLAESVEKKIVSQQRTLVKSILDNDFGNNEKSFPIDTQRLTGKDLTLTGAMIELSGVTMKKVESKLVGTGKPLASKALSALYVALYGFSLLCP